MSTQTERTTVKRIGERGAYERDVIDQILDEAIICHVGTVEDGTPMVIPTLIVRIGDYIILHGSPASRMLRSARGRKKLLGPRGWVWLAHHDPLSSRRCRARVTAT